MKKYWVISDFNSEFLARMEHILHLYRLPYNPKEPLVCFDERPCVLIEDILVPLKMKKEKPKREHYSYKRNGTCSLFVAFEPMTGKRWVRVYEKRSKIEYAKFMDYLLEQFTGIDKLHLVQDNLSTHKKGAFYEAFAAQKAFGMAEKIHFHFTPVKASWLNMVEIELSVLARKCLNRRIPNIEILSSEIKQLVKERNDIQATVNWQFSINNARNKLYKFYKNSI